MRRAALLLLLPGLLLLAACASTGGTAMPPLTTNAVVDLDRYMGRWWVIANIPYFAENGKVATADIYALRPDGRIGNVYAYRKAFERLAVDLNRADQLAAEIQSMLEGSFKNLNAEYGFSLQPPTPPQLSAYHKDLALIEKSHLQYLSLGNALRLAQPEFAERLARALMSRLRVVYDTAVNEVELWNKSAAAQLDAQLRERRRNFTRRIEAVSRIQQAAGGLDARIHELQSQQSLLNLTDAKLAELTNHLLASPEAEAIAA